jgi:hypothetical protein
MRQAKEIMIRKAVVLVLGILCFFVTGCLTQSALYSMKTLYSVIEHSGKDVVSKYTEKELLIHKKTRLTGTESVTVSVKQRGEKIESPQLILRMNYTDWQFPNSIDFNIDGNVLNLRPSSNDRNIISGNNVEETYYFTLDESHMNLLRNAQSVKLQFFKNEVITIDENGIIALHNFLNN